MAAEIFELFTGRVAAIEVDVTGKEVGYGGRSAPIRDQVNVDSDCLGEQDSAQMRVRADAGMCKFYPLTGPLHPGNWPSVAANGSDRTRAATSAVPPGA